MMHSRARGLTLLLAPSLLAVAALSFVLFAGAATYNNAAAIDVPDASYGTTAPGLITSTIPVSGSPAVTSVAVTLINLTSEYPDDLDVWVTNPAGTRVVLMSDAGGGSGSAIVNPVSLTFSDPGSTLPDSGQITSGTYRPANYGPTPDTGCPNEQDPPTPNGTLLSAFNGQQPNGDWTLFLQDDCEIYLSLLPGGWRLTINSAPTAAGVTSLRGTATGSAVILRWATGTENDMLGFNVYRAAKGSLVKVNRRLIPAKATGTARGAQYRFVDRRELTGSARYRLQVVHLDGTRAWAGSVNVYAGAISPSLASR